MIYLESPTSRSPNHPVFWVHYGDLVGYIVSRQENPLLKSRLKAGFVLLCKKCRSATEGVTCCFLKRLINTGAVVVGGGGGGGVAAVLLACLGGTVADTKKRTRGGHDQSSCKSISKLPARINVDELL